jgi:hypothetical protein
LKNIKVYLFIYLAVLGLELRASPSALSFVMGFFKIGSHELFAPLALNCNPPDLCLLSS